jgi:hypothetical protein
LWTRSIRAASFERISFDGAGVAELAEGVAWGVAETATAVCSAVAAGSGLFVDVEAAGARGLTMNPASEMPAASATTTANGASVKSVVRGINRIFIAPGVPLESNGAQRRAETQLPFDD